LSYERSFLVVGPAVSLVKCRASTAVQAHLIRCSELCLLSVQG